MTFVLSKAGFVLQATIENKRLWDLRKLKNVESKRLFRDRKWIKKTDLPCISLCFGVCLFFQWIFRFSCVTMATVTPFIRGSQGWSLRCGRVLNHSQQKCHFWAQILIRCKIFQLQPEKKSLSPFEVSLAEIYIEFALSCFSSLKLYTFYLNVFF